ncbi:hypothetical protein HanPI659440_Chr12g0448881 [Helianthus annuus]|nr:hypothetical protein HanPI659440_Chr12g0448881 [Helianthus annuus]
MNKMVLRYFYFNHVSFTLHSRICRFEYWDHELVDRFPYLVLGLLQIGYVMGSFVFYILQKGLLMTLITHAKTDVLNQMVLG